MHKHFYSTLAMKCKPIAWLENDDLATDEFSLINSAWGAWFPIVIKAYQKSF